MTASQRKPLPTWALVLMGATLLWVLAFGMCWYTVDSALGGTRAPKKFQKTDIVFGAGTGESQLGFVNADGSGLRTFRFQLPGMDYYRVWANPVITADSQTLFITSAGYGSQDGLIYMA